MTFGRPQTIGSELLDEMEALFADESKGNRFVIQKIRSDADKLAKVDAVVASIVKSSVAAFEWDISQVNYWVNNALSLSRSVATLTNAGITYRFINDFPKMFAYAEDCLKLAPKDPKVLEVALDSAMSSGFIASSIKILDSIDIQTEALQSRARNAVKVSSWLANCGILESQLQAEVAIALQVATENRVRIQSVSHVLSHDPDGRVFYSIPLSFYGTLDDEWRLESALAERLAERSDWRPHIMSVEFKHAEK